MKYDKQLLESWANMKDWGSYMIRNGALNNASNEGFDFLQKEYFLEVKRRIEYCKKLLKNHEDAFLNYVIARLYDNYDMDESDTYLYEWPVRYFCLKALEIDPDFAPARELLRRVDEWLEFITDNGKEDTLPDLDFD